MEVGGRGKEGSRKGDWANYVHVQIWHDGSIIMYNYDA